MIAFLLGVLGASSARADESAVSAGASRPSTLVAPLPASEHPPTIAVEIHGNIEAPIERSTICPGDAAGCVLGPGIGLGVRLERRAADRVGLFGAYDFLLLDTNGLFELGLLHSARGGVRYVFDDSSLVHPFVEGALGFLLFGDTAGIAAVGGVVTAGGGVEVEISHAVAFVALLEAWLFATAPFETRDHVRRSEDFGVNVAAQLSLGVSILIGDDAVR